MAKRIKNSYIKYPSKDFSSCWFCKSNTIHALLDERDQSEVWCCIKCLWEKGKIKRFNPSKRKYTTSKRKAKTERVLRVEKTEEGYNSAGGVA